MSPAFVHPMRVRFAECDPQGIVFNSRYLEYFDVAMTEIWREAIGPYDAATADNGVDLVVAEAGIRYRDSLRFDDEFELRATVSRLGTTSMTTAIEVVRDGSSSPRASCATSFSPAKAAGRRRSRPPSGRRSSPTSPAATTRSPPEGGMFDHLRS